MVIILSDWSLSQKSGDSSDASVESTRENEGSSLSSSSLSLSPLMHFPKPGNSPRLSVYLSSYVRTHSLQRQPRRSLFTRIPTTQRRTKQRNRASDSDGKASMYAMPIQLTLSIPGLPPQFLPFILTRAGSLTPRRDLPGSARMARVTGPMIHSHSLYKSDVLSCIFPFSSSLSSLSSSSFLQSYAGVSRANSSLRATRLEKVNFSAIFLRSYYEQTCPRVQARPHRLLIDFGRPNVQNCY